MKDQLLTMQSASASHVGMVRQLNEDSYISRDDIGLWAVADGMGGHQAGDMASQMVVGSLESIPAFMVGLTERRLTIRVSRKLQFEIALLLVIAMLLSYLLYNFVM